MVRKGDDWMIERDYWLLSLDPDRPCDSLAHRLKWSRIITKHHPKKRQGLLISPPQCEWKLPGSDCNNEYWDLRTATVDHAGLWCFRQTGSNAVIFWRGQPKLVWIMRFFHAVPTRVLFVQETKKHNRTFKSINETISLLFIFTTWIALSSLVSTPEGLFAQKTSPHGSGNYHLNLFYFIKLLLFGYPQCRSTGMYTKQQACWSLNQTLIRECHVSFKSFSLPSFFVPSSENKTRVIIT